ncbi:hypothetical protein [Sphingomonas bacterium]|uniref:hypothetical protein n=1 Tax=Sphingomonas bacterium TaxID=1895847 RepID=UPI001575D6E3|nr:hypothetical protein [Sphingomonas bacterium]
MIAAALVATIAAAFAPPLDRLLSYRVRDVYTGAHPATITTIDRLVFTRAGQGMIAHLTPLAGTVDGPRQERDAVSRLLDPLIGIETSVRLDRDGSPREVIDPGPAWAAFLASRAALRAKLDADRSLPAAVRAAAHKVLDAETAPAARDDRLRHPLLQILPPPLPALAPGESAGFEAAIATPRGTLPARGQVMLLSADARTLRYRITTATAPTTAGSPRFSETTELSVDRGSGLLIAQHRARALIAGDGRSQPIGTQDVTPRP